ncbi:MAG: hypothetical protein KDE15_12820, partial [Erythrobacter sp.]|nr:hypothetical protein [Erythrobacter sp.]
MTCTKTSLRNLALSSAASALAVALLASPALAEDNLPPEPPAAAQAGESPAMIREQQRYALRLMMQVYDGTRDLSHTQLLGVARLRDGDRSFTQFDYGDGAVVQTGRDGEVAASRFANLSGTERGLTYDYRTRAMSGDSAIAGFHNAVVRPLLGQSPALGRDARWNASLSLAQLGLATAAPASADVRIELSRTYFVHDGQPMVLVHYLVPAFSYVDAQGRSVVHWGEGLSLTDPGFGMVYLNAALHRSVARTADGSVPYRFARAMVAANPDGSAMLDYREVPQLAPYVDRLFGQAAMEVVPTGIASTSSAPIDAARNIDLVALSLGEDGGNEVPMASAAQLSSDRGLELMSAQQAQQMLAIQQQQITAQAMAARSQQTTITNNTNSNVSGRSPQLTSGSGGQSDGIVLSGTTRGGGEGSQSPSGSAANQALGQLGARAVTSDGGIVPGTAGGEQNLAANEAAHLVQNGGSADARSATSSPEGSAAADTLLNGITTRGDAQPAISDVQRIQSVVEYMIENL